MFGAYFGLAASYFFNNKKAIGHKQEESTYQSEMVSFFGSIILFVYWPSFNAALTSAGGQKRALINTYLSITSSGITAAALSRLQYGKLDAFVI